MVIYLVFTSSSTTSMQALKPYQKGEGTTIMRIAYSTQLTRAACNQGLLEHVATDDTEREKNAPHYHSDNIRRPMDLCLQPLNLLRIHLYGFRAHGTIILLLWLS